MGINLLCETFLIFLLINLKSRKFPENDFKEFIKPYIEYVLMHAFNTFAQLDPQRFIQLVEIVGEIRSKIAKNENAFASLMKAFELLTDQEKNNLFGLPFPLTKVLNKKIVEYAGLNIYKYLIYPLQQLKAQKIVDLPEGSIAGTSVKVNALSHAIYANLVFQIDKQISNAKMMSNGYSKIVNLIAEGLGKALAKKKEPFAIVGFLGELIQNGIFNSLLHGAIDLTRTQPARPLKVQLLFLLKPVLTNFAVKGLTPLLKKEKQGGREFDKSLLMAILPLIKDHLKQLNQPLTDQQKDFQARANAVKAANCYTDLSKKLVNLLLPNGVRDLKELFPELSEKDLQLALDLTNEIPGALASIKGSVFDTEMFRDICISVYESAIDTFKQIPTHSTPPVSVALTPEEKVWQDRLDAELEELIYEAAKLTDLPVVKLLKMARLVPGHQGLRRSIIKSIREAILKKLKNGDLVEKLITSALDSQQKMKTDKPADYYQNKLDRLEHQFVVEGILYGLRSAFESIHKALQALDYPVLKQVKDAVESLCRFIIVRIVGGLLSMTGIDNWLLNTTYAILKRNRIRIQTEFAKPAMHEVVAIDLIQAGERVLMRDWAAHPR